MSGCGSVFVEQWRHTCSPDGEGAWVCADEISYLMPGGVIVIMHLVVTGAAALALLFPGRRPITIVTAVAALMLPLAWAFLHGSQQPLPTPHLLTMLLLGASAAITLVGGLSSRRAAYPLLAIAVIVAVVPAFFAHELRSVIVLQAGLTMVTACVRASSPTAERQTSRVS